MEVVYLIIGTIFYFLSQYGNELLSSCVNERKREWIEVKKQVLKNY